MKEFDKIIGYSSIKEELKRTADIIRDPEKYEMLGVKMPRGLLLYGDPGVGKSLMAECFIEACGVKSFVLRKDSPDGDFVMKIREVFENAKASAPAVILLDDLDKFTKENNANNNAEEFVAVQSGMDGVKGSKVFVIATANSTFCLPNSLMRAGRLDTVLEVEKPKGQDAVNIIKHYLSKKSCMSSVDAVLIGRMLNGSSCAELEAIINQAGIYAGYAGKTQIETDDMIRAVLRLKFKSTESAEEYDGEKLQEVAYHEAGHLVVAELLRPSSVALASVCKYEGKVGGIVANGLHIENWSVREFDNEVKILLAGKASVFVNLGIDDTGAISDMRTAFQILRDNAKKRILNGFDCYDFEFQMSSKYAEHVENVVYREIKFAYDEAKRLISENQALVDAFARELMEKKTILASDIQRIKEKVQKSSQN